MPSTWSKRARASCTWCPSVSGSLRCLGNAKTLSANVSRSCVLRSPCSVCGRQVICSLIVLLRSVYLLDPLAYGAKRVPPCLSVGASAEYGAASSQGQGSHAYFVSGSQGADAEGWTKQNPRRQGDGRPGQRRRRKGSSERTRTSNLAGSDKNKP